MSSTAEDRRTGIDPSTRPTGLRRGVLAINAAVAWVAVTVSLTLNLTGYYLSEPNTGSVTLLGNVAGGEDTALERFFDWTTYFTILSNTTAAIVVTALLLRPTWFTGADRRGLIWRALRVDSVMMLVVTAVVFNLLLATGGKTGWDAISNSLLHIINPTVTALAWLIVGPRGLIRWSTIWAALVLPLAWAAYALIRGAVIHAYPYPFFDVQTNGLPSVLEFVAIIAVFGVAVAATMLGIDALLRRVLPARQ
jgi:Ni,Fe-hydrogenase I cytochrome b subunit